MVNISFQIFVLPEGFLCATFIKSQLKSTLDKKIIAIGLSIPALQSLQTLQ